MKDLSNQQNVLKRAVIYCRVSEKKQTSDGSGLSSQEHRCRQYAEAKGYDVVELFPDDRSAGGDFVNRPGMVALLHFLDSYPNERFVVIFDDLKRYSRDTEFHLKLRRVMLERGAIRECLNFNFEDSPEGKFNETISAAAGTYERETMGRQNLQKSVARLEQGYCIQSMPPLGYKYIKSKVHGKILVRNEPYASIVQESLEGYATGRFASQSEVKRFLESHSGFPLIDKHGTVRQQRVVELLKRHLYAGLIDGRSWGVSIREGKHEGLISIATFERIQKKLEGRVYAPARKDIADDFPLRGSVCCSSCDTTLTACWSQGKRKKYPYYYCRAKECALYGKTIARDKIEKQFEKLLSEIQPTKGLVDITAAMFRDCWNTQIEQGKEIEKAITRQLAEAEKKIEKILDAVVEASNPRVISAYEKQIDKLERETLLLREKERNLEKSPNNFDDLFEHSIKFISNPCNLWKKGKIEIQRLVLKLTFSGHLHYCRETGFRTPQTTVPFNFLGNLNFNSVMVPEGGIEPPTRGFSILCSTPELLGHGHQQRC